MKQKIKFRGKRIDNMELIYGSLIVLDDDHCFIVPRFKEASTMSCGQIVRETMEAVDPETIGQYTGKNDKDGAELYDGDILHRDCYGDVRIEFEKGVFWVRDAGGVRYANRCCDIPISYFPTEDYEKIGNIHNNPELLEVRT